MPIEIIKSKSDKRDYRYFELPNKLRAILIHDPEGDKAAAALDVKVGCSLDPKPLYGTAHFLEHMLFQGTEKYPSESEYSEFMSKNGGYNNAFTSLTDTNFHFECSNEAFEEGLDRMAQFFISPKFSIDSADREKNAVDSEFKMSLQNDSWHFFNLKQQVSNKDSSMCRFNCGNLATLSQEGIRDSLLAFHKKWYSSNIMTLTVTSNHSLESMQEWVTSKFSEVVNKDIVIPDLCEPHPYPEANRCKLIRYVPVKDVNEISFFWVLPYFEKDLKGQPTGYFSHLIGHEGENSLLSYLKSEGLATELSAGGGHKLWGMSTMEVKIKLTETGLKQYEKVIEATFQYIQRLVEVGPKKWIFDEINDLGKFGFEFQEKGKAMSACVGLAGRMQIFDELTMSQILRSRQIREEFNEDLCQDIAKRLADYKNCMILIKSKSFEQASDKVAQWYDTKYSIEDYSESLIKRMAQPACEIKQKKLDLPPANNLIPKNFDLLPKDESLSKEPQCIEKTPESLVWYMKDDKFEMPKACVGIKVYCPQDADAFGSVEKRMFARVWESVIGEYLAEFRYMAECAKLDSSVTILSDGFLIYFNGFNDSMPNYIKETFKRIIEMRDADVEMEFSQMKEMLLQKWKNTYLTQSYLQVLPLVDNGLVNCSIEYEQLISSLEPYTYAQFQGALKDWMTSGQLLFYFHGNLNKDVCLDIAKNSREVLKLTPLAISELTDVCAMKLDTGKTLCYEALLKDEKNDNSCSLIVYQGKQPLSKETTKDELLSDLVGHWIEVPFFDDLRTKQQLGYVVAARKGEKRGTPMIWFGVQSPTKCAEYLVGQTNKFLIATKEKIADLTDETFESEKSAIRTIIAEKDPNLAAAARRVFGLEVTTHRYQFERQQKELELLETITKDEFKAYFHQMFFSAESARLDLMLTAKTHKDQQAEQAAENAKDDIFKALPRAAGKSSNLNEMKKTLTMLPNIYKQWFAEVQGQEQ